MLGKKSTRRKPMKELFIDGTFSEKKERVAFEAMNNGFFPPLRQEQRDCKELNFNHSLCRQSFE